ncbi:hypothetical protein LXL04_023301 [Taraxacum kok-saghyz]
MVRDPLHSLQRRSYSQAFPNDDFSITRQSLTLSTPFLPEGARLMIPKGGQTNLVISVYDNEPTSIIAYALSSKEHDNWITDRLFLNETDQRLRLHHIEEFILGPSFLTTSDDDALMILKITLLLRGTVGRELNTCILPMLFELADNAYN